MSKIKKEKVCECKEALNGVHRRELISDIINNKDLCPFPIEVIPNKMGINLSSVSHIEWREQRDGQLINVNICFLPNDKEQILKKEVKLVLRSPANHSLKECLEELKQGRQSWQQQYLSQCIDGIAAFSAADAPQA